MTDSTLIIATDQADYAPGATAIIDLSGVSIGEIVELQVSQILNPGTDGLFGTSDDVLAAPGSTPNSTPWYITNGAGFTLAGSDGTMGTADDIVVMGTTPTSSGTLQSTWYVDAAYSSQTLLLTAQVVTVDGNTVAETGTSASLVFTDADPPPAGPDSSPVLH